MFFWLLNAAQEAEQAAETAGETESDAGEGAAHHTPIVVDFVNHYIGEPVYEFQIHYTKPLWDRFFANFGTTAENVFGPYTPENAVPWWTVMFVIACIISVTLIWILKGRLSTDEPEHGQQTLEAAVLAIRGMLVDIVGPHGVKHFPVVGTFAVL